MKNKPKLTLRLDFRSGLPIYTQIVNQIQTQVLGNMLKVGDQLPTVRTLANELGINFNTVARAYRLLDDARVISTQHGRGTFILEIPPPAITERLLRESLDALTSRFVEEAMQMGFPSAEIKRVVAEHARVKRDAQK
jgi:GntR family transcriptional regulator